MQLITPSVEYIDSYRAALTEFEQQGISGFWHAFGPIDDAEEYVRRITNYTHRSPGAPHDVPASVYWLVDGGEFIGHTSIRHRLNASLQRHGGHLGYAIRPSNHRRGYGSAILQLALPIAGSLGIESALLTCASDNVGSRKIIERHGGRFDRTVVVEGQSVLQYWIDLPSRKRNVIEAS